MSEQIITWYPVAIQPQFHERCIVHCTRQYFQLGVWDSEAERFWDKDGQPIVGGIEWAYMPDREE